MRRSAMILCLLAAGLAPLSTARGAVAGARAPFSSARSLLLTRAELPPHYRLLSSSVQDSVDRWDGGIRQVIAVDVQNGWQEAATESALDASRRPVDLSVQLFETSGGALRDFGDFFTNAHPETIYVPGESWLGGAAVRGIGDRATLYRITDDNTTCSAHLATGLSFVYLNALVSIQVCTRGAGERAARDLAARVLRRATRSGRG